MPQQNPCNPVLLSTLYPIVFIVGKCILNLACIPYYGLRYTHRFVHTHLRQFVDSLINLDLCYAQKIQTLDLHGLQHHLKGPRPHLYLNFENQYGNINFIESVVLSYLVQCKAPLRIFEIGTFDGFSTYHLAKNAPTAGTVYTLNLPEDATMQDYLNSYSLMQLREDDNTHRLNRLRGIGRVYKTSDVANRVVQLIGNSLSFDYRPFLDTIDLCFVDGGHSCQHVKSDTINALSLLRRGGILVWHDYNNQHKEVCCYLNKLACTLKLYHVLNTRLVFYQRPV